MLARVFGVGACLCGVIVSCGESSDSGHSGASGAGGEIGAEAGAAEAGGGAGAAEAGGTAGQASVAGEGGVGGAGAAGEGGGTGEAVSAGLIVVGTTVTGATALLDRYYVVLLDPADGHELARTDLPLGIRGLAYEAQRDKWFVFTGTPGQGGAEPNGPLLVGTMTTTGFAVEQTVMVPKPTNQDTIAVLNERILYRSVSHTGASVIDDTLVLLDTSASAKVIGKLTIPYRYALVGAVGAPALGAAGGRVFFLHDNLDDSTDNCVPPDVGTEAACTVYSSSLAVAPSDTNLTLRAAGIGSVAQVDRDGSDAALGIQPGGTSVVIVVPPRRAVGTHAGVYRYDALTGDPVEPNLDFTLETATKKIDPTNSITIPTVAVDPCEARLFTGELANAGLLYAVPFSAPQNVVAFDPASHDGTVGTVVYEPFTHTLISYNSNPQNPTFSGLQISGSTALPQIALRGSTGPAPWLVPKGLVPLIVAARDPLALPCE